MTLNIVFDFADHFFFVEVQFVFNGKQCGSVECSLEYSHANDSTNIIHEQLNSTNMYAYYIFSGAEHSYSDTHSLCRFPFGNVGIPATGQFGFASRC